MAKDDDILAKHAESRRAFLAKTAVVSPAVSLLLAQSARPARAQTYGGGPPITTPPPFVTTAVTLPITTASQVTTAVTLPITTASQVTTASP